MGKREGAATLGESGFARRALDAYYTEPRCTKVLTDNVNFSGAGLIWECAAGRGDMATALAGAGYNVVATDINSEDSDGQGLDFLRDAAPAFVDKVSAIVTNPPYNEAEAFIRRAIHLMEPRQGKVAMFTRLEYLSASTRRWMSTEAPLALQIQLTFRPRWDWWLPPDQRTGGGPRHNFCWTVWDWKHLGQTPYFRVAP